MQSYSRYQDYGCNNLNQNLVLAGIYSGTSVIKGEGYFLMSVNGTNPYEKTLSFNPFSKEMIEAGVKLLWNPGVAETAPDSDRLVGAERLELPTYAL